MQVTANPAQVQLGQSTVVSWSVTLPTGCTVVVRFNGQVVGKNGSQTVTPPGTRNYNLTISRSILGVLQQRSVSARVEVLFPDRVVIDPTTPNPVQVLISALGSNPVTIFLSRNWPIGPSASCDFVGDGRLLNHKGTKTLISFLNFVS